MTAGQPVTTVSHKVYVFPQRLHSMADTLKQQSGRPQTGSAVALDTQFAIHLFHKKELIILADPKTYGQTKRYLNFPCLPTINQ